MKQLISIGQTMELSTLLTPRQPSVQMQNLTADVSSDELVTAIQSHVVIDQSYMPMQVIQNMYALLQYGDSKWHLTALYILQNYTNVFDIDTRFLQALFFRSQSMTVKRNVLLLLSSQNVDLSDFISSVLDSFLHTSRIYYILTPLCRLLQQQSEQFGDT